MNPGNASKYKQIRPNTANTTENGKYVKYQDELPGWVTPRIRKIIEMSNTW